MKLPGIDYNTPVQSLGRENPSGPVRVAAAQASLAEKKVSTASQVAGNLTSIGRIHAAQGREIAASQRSNIARTRQFAADIANVARAGNQLMADIVKADVTRDIAEYERKVTELKEGMAGENAIRTMQVLRDPNDPSQGTKTVSLAVDLPGAFEKELNKLNEQTVNNSNWLARGMMTEMVYNQSESAKLDIQRMANAWQKDFSAGQGLEAINEKVLRQDWAGARELHNELRGLYSGAKNASIAATLDAAQHQSDLDNLAFDSANKITANNNSFTSRMAAAEKIRNKEVRQGTIAIIQRQQRTIDYAIAKGKENQVLANRDHNINQMNTLPPDQWTVFEGATAAQRNSFETYRDKMIKNEPVVTDEVLLSDLRKMAFNDWEAFRQVDLQLHRDKLEERYWNELDKLQMANPKTSKETNPYGFNKINQIGSDYFAQLGIDNKKKPSQMLKQTKIQNIVYDQVQYLESEGVKVTDQQVNDMYRTIAREVNEESFIELDVMDNDEFLQEIIIQSGQYVGADTLTTERQNFLDWATATQDTLRKANKPEATPEELQLIYRRNRIR